MNRIRKTNPVVGNFTMFTSCGPDCSNEQSVGNFRVNVNGDQVELEIRFDPDEDGFRQTIKLCLDANEARELGYVLLSRANYLVRDIRMEIDPDYRAEMSEE